MVSDERGLGTLTRRLVHPTSPNLLTRRGPLETLYSKEPKFS